MVTLIQETTKTCKGSMSPMKKLTELAKTNFEPDSFIVELSYLRTQAVIELIQ